MLVGARYYDAQVGRFISRDTYLDQPPYLYCDHDPVNAVDPSGHWPTWGEVGTVIGGAIGGIVGGIVEPVGGELIGVSIGAGLGRFIGGLFDGERPIEAIGSGILIGGGTYLITWYFGVIIGPWTPIFKNPTIGTIGKTIRKVLGP